MQSSALRSIAVVTVVGLVAFGLMACESKKALPSPQTSPSVEDVVFEVSSQAPASKAQIRSRFDREAPKSKLGPRTTPSGPLSRSATMRRGLKLNRPSKQPRVEDYATPPSQRAQPAPATDAKDPAAKVENNVVAEPPANPQP
ncbi:MAG: hypothetical protein RBU37_17905 [Myxococcota bacterium]|jgi:hypothetical protein|nr:hypothetical protein [Myxococcota bacterium]